MSKDTKGEHHLRNNSVSSTDKLQGERERETERERGVRQREGKRGKEGRRQKGRIDFEPADLKVFKRLVIN